MIAWAILAALLVSTLGTGLVRRFALRSGMLDVPNQRSMHVTSTPRGGGIAIIAAVVVGTILLGSGGVEKWPPAWLVGALAIGIVGYIDDRRGLSVRSRLIVQCFAAAVLVASAPPLLMPMLGGPVVLGPAGMLIAWLATVWSVNLFNFMDGIDGIASMQAVFVFAAAALLAVGAGQSLDSIAWLGVLAAGALGFLPWNWAPARIFMGDVGSGFLGYLIVVGALRTSDSGYINVWTWIILYGTFIADSTVTLAVRFARGQHVFQPHRSHVYQRLARRFDSHGATVVLFAAVDIFWLLPCAAATIAWPNQAPVITGIALIPLMASVYKLGGGRS